MDKTKNFSWVTIKESAAENGLKTLLIYVLDQTQNRVSGYIKRGDDFELVVITDYVFIQECTLTEGFMGMRSFLYSKDELLQEIGKTHFLKIGKREKVKKWLGTMGLVILFVATALAISYFFL